MFTQISNHHEDTALKILEVKKARSGWDDSLGGLKQEM